MQMCIAWADESWVAMGDCASIASCCSHTTSDLSDWLLVVNCYDRGTRVPHKLKTKLKPKLKMKVMSKHDSGALHSSALYSAILLLLSITVIQYMEEH